MPASDNNRAEIVLQVFLQSVEFGLPSRVRTDKGGENVDVAAYMLSRLQRGPSRGSMITGLYCKYSNNIFIINCTFRYFSHLKQF
jgi:hypothetical protein